MRRPQSLTTRRFVDSGIKGSSDITDLLSGQSESTGVLTRFITGAQGDIRVCVRPLIRSNS